MHISNITQPIAKQYLNFAFIQTSETPWKLFKLTRYSLRILCNLKDLIEVYKNRKLGLICYSIAHLIILSVNGKTEICFLKEIG